MTVVPGADRAHGCGDGGQRVFGMALGYEDLIDHDQLRHDPVLATLAGKLEARRRDARRWPARARSTGWSTRPWTPSRYHKIGHDAAAIESLFVDLFLEAHETPPKRSSSISMPPTIRCTATRRAASSTATTIAIAICRCSVSAAGTCSRPSSAAPTSMRRPVPLRRSRASSPRSASAGRG